MIRYISRHILNLEIYIRHSVKKESKHIIYLWTQIQALHHTANGLISLRLI